jgi:hypothetical protein
VQVAATHLLRELRGLAEAKTQSLPDVVSLLITAAELHVRADLGVVDAAERTLAAGGSAAPVSSGAVLPAATATGETAAAG